MQPVILDQIMDPPVRFDDVSAMKQQAGWCMEQYRIDHISSLVALDGRRMVCNLTAPDAEAVRNAMRQLGSGDETIWPCTVEGPAVKAARPVLGQTGTSLICVDRTFADPIVLADLNAQEERNSWCLEEHGVRFLLTYFGIDRRRMICVYTAPDAESVRIAQTKATMPFDRVWAAQLFKSTA